MRTIAILTDFGLTDNYTGVMKGVILKINPNVNIIDISHDIEPQDISGAALILKGSYKYFPKKTIFLVVVDPGVGSGRLPIIVYSRNYIFVGPDNGVLNLAAKEDGIKRIIEIRNKKYFIKPVSDTFHGRDIFAPASAYLSKGKSGNLLGPSLDSMKELVIPKPEIDKNIIKGKVIHIDRFGDLVTNIDRKLFYRITKNKKFRIKIKNKFLSSIAKSYKSVRPGEPLAIFGSLNFLEISVNGGSAQERFSAKKGYEVSIKVK